MPTAYAGESIGDRVNGCANDCANDCGNGKLYELNLNFKSATSMPASCKNGDARIYQHGARIVPAFHHGARIVPARIDQSHNKKGRGLRELTETTIGMPELTKATTGINGGGKLPELTEGYELPARWGWLVTRKVSPLFLVLESYAKLDNGYGYPPIRPTGIYTRRWC